MYEDGLKEQQKQQPVAVEHGAMHALADTPAASAAAQLYTTACRRDGGSGSSSYGHTWREAWLDRGTPQSWPAGNWLQVQPKAIYAERVCSIRPQQYTSSCAAADAAQHPSCSCNTCSACGRARHRQKQHASICTCAGTSSGACQSICACTCAATCASAKACNLATIAPDPPARNPSTPASSSSSSSSSKSGSQFAEWLLDGSSSTNKGSSTGGSDAPAPASSAAAAGADYFSMVDRPAGAPSSPLLLPPAAAPASATPASPSRTSLAWWSGQMTAAAAAAVTAAPIWRC
ncbi:hypothetical protein COO60DRAFT_246431 [Scenedesmus sp. NREL 46B-D3]|nr:hypothetical protein COO60DRAFT_246431 [Scenedesmus sp. NREL 46B-D3]